MTDRVPTRRIAFEFDASRMPRHYARNAVLSSHTMTLASDHDTTELVAQWRARLFEGDGYLAGRARGVA